MCEGERERERERDRDREMTASCDVPVHHVSITRPLSQHLYILIASRTEFLIAVDDVTEFPLFSHARLENSVSLSLETL